MVVLHCVTSASIVRTYHHILRTIGAVLDLSHGGIVVLRSWRASGGCGVVRRGEPGVDMRSGEPATHPGLVQIVVVVVVVVDCY